MSRQQRKYVAIWMTLGIIFQSILIPYFNRVEGLPIDSSISSVYDHSIREQSPMLIIQSSTDLAVPVFDVQFSIKELILSQQELIYDHYANQVKTLLLCNENIDLIFTIKELKFPTHYFW